jgi:hypothetical protein
LAFVNPEEPTLVRTASERRTERASSKAGDWLTYASAAERLNTTRDAVRQKAIRGRWQRTIGNDYCLTFVLMLSAAVALVGLTLAVALNLHRLPRHLRAGSSAALLTAA